MSLMMNDVGLCYCYFFNRKEVILQKIKFIEGQLKWWPVKLNNHKWNKLSVKVYKFVAMVLKIF